MGDAGNLGQLVGGGAADVVQVVKMIQQRLASFGTNAGNAVQNRSGSDFGPPFAVAFVGEAVSLIP